MAMGWGLVDMAGQHFVLATGAAPGTQTRLALLPEENVAVAVLCNATSADELALWRIEWQTFAAMIPGFPAPPAIPSETPAAFVPPPELAGEWQGLVQTHQGDKPLKLSIKSAQELSIENRRPPGKAGPHPDAARPAAIP